MTGGGPTQHAGARRGNAAAGILVLSAVLGLVLAIAVLVGSVQREPGIGGWLTGIFSGLFLGLLVCAAGAWFGLWTMRAPKVETPQQVAAGDALMAGVSDVLADLEKMRIDLTVQIRERARWRTPLGAAAGTLVGLYGYFWGESDTRGDIFSVLMMIGFGALCGYAWAAFELQNRYRRAYKDKVLPRLAASFGDISYRSAVVPDLSVLISERLFRPFNDISAEDQLYGARHGLPVVLTELSLANKTGKNSESVFQGLLVEVAIPRRLTGLTAVVADGGGFGNFRNRLATSRERIRLEDPVFEAAYEVYGTDQVEARALLNPAFMERLLKLGEAGDFSRPLVLARDSLLWIALPRSLPRALFQTPPFGKPAAHRETVMRLHADIEAVLQVADAVIALDGRAPPRATSAQAP
jgi:hypothetical protein